MTMNLPRDFEDRWQRIRKYSAICNDPKCTLETLLFCSLDNRFDSTKPHEVLSLHEVRDGTIACKFSHEKSRS